MARESERLFTKAKGLIPGGVNSPVRAGKAVGMDPLFISGAEGPYLWDVEGRRYIDYVGSWGPMIVGHAHPAVVEALREALARGTSYGAPTPAEVEMAQMLVDMVPSLEQVRMVNSGTEATMSAIRLARAATGREKIVKFEGCYHGHADSLLVSAGSGVATLGIPGSPGVPSDLARHTLSLPYNNLRPLEEAFARYGSEIAAVIVEPVAGNMGVVPPREGFLEGLRNLTQEHEALLIFDEVITGFRLSPGGAQQYYGILPDLTCLGKIIGGGLPVGAYGGRRDLMSQIAPEGAVYQAGTLSGNPLAMAAGLATLKLLKEKEFYADLEQRSAWFFDGLLAEARAARLPATLNRVGSMGTLFFTSETVTDFASAKRSDGDMFRRFYQGMLREGIYLAPSPFEATFVSSAHTEALLQETLACAARVLRTL